MHHIGIGRTHARTRVLTLVVLTLVRDLHITVLDAITGEILRELVLDPDRGYRPHT